MRRSWILIVSIVFAVPMNGGNQPPEAIATPDKGEAIYQQHCLRCHGADGKGQGPDAKLLIVQPTNFHSRESRSKSDMELLSAIVWGRAFSPMHGWSDRLSPEEMQDVIGYIRRMALFHPPL